MRALVSLSTLALVLIGSSASDVARADIGPPRTCNLEGKGCETCPFAAGKSDEACVAEKKSKGLVMTCQSGGASNGSEYYCPPGTKEGSKSGDSGCRQTPSTTPPLLAVITGLVFLVAMTRKRARA